VQFVPIDGGLRNGNIISQESTNFLTEYVWGDSPDIYTPIKLSPTSTPTATFDFQQVAMPMVHPKTGETISSYKQLMQDPATAKIWQTAFGKDFGGIAQGALKTGQKGTNLIFVMTNTEIQNIPRNQTVTYAHVVVDFCPQKVDPHCIRITAEGHLINYPVELSTRTADLTTSKLMWKSVLSMEAARYMWLDIENFCLAAPLDHYEYMKISLNIFPEWVIKQYDLNKHALISFIYLEMRHAV
jgi:hypothetical protein